MSRKLTFRRGGIHIPEHKETSPSISMLPLPMKAVVPLAQHIGHPAVATVKRGDRVERGMQIGRAEGAVSANVHAPVSGTVTAVGPMTSANGYDVVSVEITASESDHAADEDARASEAALSLPDLSGVTAAEVVEAVSRCGIVGQGGAMFPSQVKLAPKVSVDTLVINGAECEPFLTCDNAVMTDFPAEVVEGTRLMALALGTKRVVIAVEDNKPQAIAALSRAAQGTQVEVVTLRTRYPQGGEKQLIDAVTGREVPSGHLPADIGVVIHNVATARAVCRAVAFGLPLTERVVTLARKGAAGVEAGNYQVAVGTPLSALTGDPAGVKVINGGPMMGKAVVCVDAPVTKGTSGLLVLEAGETRRRKADPCLRCGACVEACPMGLEPYLLSAYGRLRLTADAAHAGVADCIECGSCTYVCPSSRPLLDYIADARRALRSMPHK